MSSRGRSQAGARDINTHWRPWFMLAIIALVVSALVFVIVLFGLSSGGSDNPGSPILPGGATATATRTAAPGGDPTTAPAQGTTPPGGTAEPRETPTKPPAEPTEEGDPLPCGDIMAPLNKVNYLSPSCAPGDLVAIPAERTGQGTQYLRAAAADALLELMDAASADGFELYAISGYRSYEGQVAAYQSNLAACGGDSACADRVSARPGHSEHQLGTTMDVSSASAGYGLESFVGTPEADWVRDNSWKYGFVVSYPEGTEQITGYAFEPWHIRWIGKTEAANVHASGLTLHEYLAGH